jgi:hypothetical protein
LRLGHEPACSGHPGPRPARLVLGPGLGQVQFPVDQRPSARARVGREHTDLAVVDLPGGAGVLPGDARGGLTLLDEAGVVDDQHVAALAEVFEDVVAHVVADPVGIPGGRAEQVLEPIRGRVPGVLGNLPGVLSLHRTEQTTYVIVRMSPWFYSAEPSRDTREQLLELPRPGLELDRYILHGPHNESQTSKTRPTTGVLAAFERAGRALAAGIACTAMLVDIKVAVIGGGAAKAGPLLFDPLARHLTTYASLPFTGDLTILPATLGAAAGLIGAAALADWIESTSGA